ncbi:hypothetical protein LINPERHAP1_LOCUS14717, partial [Linum perenne]
MKTNGDIGKICCYCGIEVVQRVSHTSKNPDRPFLSCTHWRKKGANAGCGFFRWCDGVAPVGKAPG